MGTNDSLDICGGTVREESKKLLSIKDSLHLKVINECPVFWGHTNPPLDHSIGENVPSINAKITHIIHPLPGLVALLRLYQRRGGMHKEETAA